MGDSAAVALLGPPARLCNGVALPANALPFDLQRARLMPSDAMRKVLL